MEVKLELDDYNKMKMGSKLDDHAMEASSTKTKDISARHRKEKRCLLQIRDPPE